MTQLKKSSCKKIMLPFAFSIKGGGGGGGVPRIQKLLGRFFGSFFWTLGGRLKLFQKFGVSFEVVLRHVRGCFEVVFGGIGFQKSA